MKRRWQRAVVEGDGGSLLVAVLDTNVLVAASRSSRGASSILLSLLAADRYHLAISVALVLEYEEVLLREVGELNWSEKDIAVLLDFICKAGKPQEISFNLRPVLNGPDDDFLLELAFAAGVDYLVTHNVHDFEKSKAYGIAVVTPKQFLKNLGYPP